MDTLNLVYTSMVATAALALIVAIVWFLLAWLVLDRPDASPSFRAGQRVPEWDTFQEQEHQREWERQVRLERAARRRRALSPYAQAQVTLRVLQATAAAARRLAEDPLTARVWHVDPAEFIPGFMPREVVPWAFQ